jgi:hypothetical protein
MNEPKGPFDAAEKEIIQRLYCDEGLLCREVGERMGLSEYGVRRRMKAFGIPRRDDRPQRHQFRPGYKNPAWKGGRYIDNDGYVRIWIGDDKYAYEHKQIVEKALGRKLTKNERVHHINENRSDNRNRNLLVCSTGYHLNLHLKMKRMEAAA